MMQQAVTVKEFAGAHRVSERTVWRWIERGAVGVYRTPGGGVRIVEERREIPILSPRESGDVGQNRS